jgi:hypothetical protein
MCTGIQFSELEGNVNIQIDSGFRFVNTLSLSSGAQNHSSCAPAGLIELQNVIPNEEITVSGIYGTPTLEQGTGTLNWENGLECGTDDIPADTNIYFFYDRGSLSDQEVILAGRAAKAWVESTGHIGPVFHIQITGGRWIQWAEFPKTGMFGGLFGDSTQTTTSTQGNIGNVVNYTGNGTPANPYVFNLDTSAQLYPSNETGVLWNEANIAVGNVFGDPLSSGVVYDGTPAGIPDLRSNSKNVLVVNLLNESHANVRTSASLGGVGEADYHSIGPGSQSYSGNLGVVTKDNWGNGSDISSGWPGQTIPILPGSANNNIQSIYEAVSNVALTYRDINDTFTAASPEYLNKIAYFEAWKQSVFYSGSDPYNGEVRPSKMEDEVQFNGSTGFSASWERDYRRFVFLYDNYKQGPTNTTYLEDVADGFRVNFLTYAVKPANIGPQHIGFPLHVVAAITDNATYTNSSNVSVTVTGGTIEQSNLPTNGIISDLTNGVVTTLTPLTYISANNVLNGQNPYFDSGLGALSQYQWGYNIDQDVHIYPAGAANTHFQAFFIDDLNSYLESTSCNNTDCLRISVLNETTGNAVPNLEVSLPGSPLSPLITDSNGEVFYPALRAGPYSVMDCYQFNSLGSCINWKMVLIVKTCTYTADGYSACTDPAACNYDPIAQYEDGSCYFPDCNGDCNGTAFIDECGNCVEGNTGLEENYAHDVCGVCDGGNIGVDECGECFGNNSECAGCTDPTSKNYDPTAIIDDGSCTCSIQYYECILKEMAKTIVKDCSEKCQGVNCEEYNSSLYEDFRTVDSLLTQVKTYNAGICSESSKEIIIEAIRTIELLTSDWNCSNCKNC